MPTGLWSTGLAGLGGKVQYREDDIDYIRATVPADKVEAAAALKGVQALEVDAVIPLPDPRPDDGTDGQVVPTPQTPPSAATPRNNPYMPIGDTGAAAFLAAHPTWDGRGVTVGVLDSGITLDHPALATTTVGTPKIIDWVTYTDPVHRQRPDVGSRDLTGHRPDLHGRHRAEHRHLHRPIGRLVPVRSLQ